MAATHARRMWESVFAIGSHQGESDIQRGKRRILVGYLVFGALTRFAVSATEFSEGVRGNGTLDLTMATTSVILLAILGIRPRWFVGIVNASLLLMLVEVLVATILYGGIIESNAIILFGLLSVIGSLILLSVRAASVWLVAFLATLALAVVLPEHIEAVDPSAATSGEVAFTIVGVTAFLFAAMAYFVRQRDRFQRESDDLLHNILPDEIARRLKSDRSMIADDYAEASVLFADVVDFTPMSATMSPPELVGLLNAVFTTFDGFVEELGLEKIKTVGDEYMVAAGVPTRRPDHAQAIAELALRIRDHTNEHDFAGHRMNLRIGINSGPLVAGIVGTHKFAYDLWGDVVNTASRMESEGIPGSIQIAEATHELIKDDFDCQPRGVIAVKGKGTMPTYLLLSRRTTVD